MAEQVGFFRLRQILEMLPISRSSFWQGVKNGTYPASVKIGPRTTAWKKSDIYALIEKLGGGTASDSRFDIQNKN
jgi:prophage regulatory protein